MEDPNRIFDRIRRQRARADARRPPQAPAVPPPPIPSAPPVSPAPAPTRPAPAGHALYRQIMRSHDRARSR